MRPLVVSLDSGATVRRPLVGLHPAAYADLRLGRTVDQQLIVGLSAELVAQRKLLAHDSVNAATQAQALADCRREWAGTSAMLNAQEVRTAKALARPSQQPLLLDPNTYKGAGALALIGTLIKIFAH